MILVAYYRNPLGWWFYWTKSPPIPAAADWTQATWKTPNAPMNATAISVGISAVAMGTLSVDDIRLIDPAGPAVGPGGTDDAGAGPVDMGTTSAADGGETMTCSEGFTFVVGSRYVIFAGGAPLETSQCRPTSLVDQAEGTLQWLSGKPRTVYQALHLSATGEIISGRG